MDNNITQEDKGGGGAITIHTYNVRGLRDNVKRARMFNLFKNSLKGIIFLQEMHAVPQDLELWQ